MSGPGPKTTWEELANLGWHEEDVYNALNNARGGTIGSNDNLHLNEGIDDHFQWYCYNVIKGNPVPGPNAINTITSSDTAWTYDNTGDSQPFTTSVTETWNNTETASVTVSTSSSISLGASISIPDVGGSSFNITISTEETNTISQSSSYSLSQSWTITVAPGEKVTIMRTKTTVTGTTVYSLAYGLDPNSLIGTEGDEYDGHWYWAYSPNDYLNSPSGTMAFNGFSVKTSYAFTIVRTGGSGTSGTSPVSLRVVEKLASPTFAMKKGTTPGAVANSKIEFARPGPTTTPPAGFKKATAVAHVNLATP